MSEQIALFPDLVAPAPQVCLCQILGKIRPECRDGIFEPFKPLACPMSVEKILGPVPTAKPQTPRKKFFCAGQCGERVTRQGIKCAKCRKKERTAALCRI